MVLARRASRPLSRLVLLAGVACSPQYQLLETFEATVGGAETGGSGTSGGSPSGGSPSGGTGVAGASAGEATEGGASGEEGGGTASSGAGGASASGGGATACTQHADCESGSRCSSYQCVACAALAGSCPKACANGFELVTVERNGCRRCECAPRSECTSSADCGSGEACYRGAQCREGCDDPSCCFGNRCSRAGCSTLPAVTACLAFGCGDGHECLASCDETTCTCDGESWACESTTGGDAVTSCPQACAPL